MIFSELIVLFDMEGKGAGGGLKNGVGIGGGNCRFVLSRALLYFYSFKSTFIYFFW